MLLVLLLRRLGLGRGVSGEYDWWKEGLQQANKNSKRSAANRCSGWNRGWMEAKVRLPRTLRIPHRPGQKAGVQTSFVVAKHMLSIPPPKRGRDQKCTKTRHRVLHLPTKRLSLWSRRCGCTRHKKTGLPQYASSHPAHGKSKRANCELRDFRRPSQTPPWAQARRR